jgi:hypothetical protein
VFVIGKSKRLPLSLPPAHLLSEGGMHSHVYVCVCMHTSQQPAHAQVTHSNLPTHSMQGPSTAATTQLALGTPADGGSGESGSRAQRRGRQLHMTTVAMKSRLAAEVEEEQEEGEEEQEEAGRKQRQRVEAGSEDMVRACWMGV